MVHSFKLSATFEHPLDRLVSLAREIDLVHILDERLSGKILEQPSLFDGTFHIHVKTPWPFPRDLDLCLYACGADLAQVQSKCPLSWANPEMPQKGVTASCGPTQPPDAGQAGFVLHLACDASEEQIIHRLGPPGLKPFQAIHRLDVTSALALRLLHR